MSNRRPFAQFAQSHDGSVHAALCRVAVQFGSVPRMYDRSCYVAITHSVSYAVRVWMRRERLREHAHLSPETAKWSEFLDGKR